MSSLIRIIYEDNDYIAVSKPPGMLVHSAKGHEVTGETVAEWLSRHRPEVRTVGDDPSERPGIVHRLDKETSGVLIAAKNNRSFEYLKGLFQNGKVAKTYFALVWGKVVGSGKIDRPIGLRAGTVRRSVRARKMKMVKEAITEYRAVKSYKLNTGRETEFLTLLRVFPKTGRTHQIRVHLASIGHPVAGDKLYGPNKVIPDLSRQFLHAESIEFTALSGSRLKIETELPEELKTVLESLENKNPEA